MKKTENLKRTDPLWLWFENLLRIMKISAILFFVTVLNIFGSVSYAQNTKLSLNMKDVPVLAVLNAIEEKSEFFFLYSSKMIDVNRKVLKDHLACRR